MEKSDGRWRSNIDRNSGERGRLERIFSGVMGKLELRCKIRGKGFRIWVWRYVIGTLRVSMSVLYSIRDFNFNSLC